MNVREASEALLSVLGTVEGMRVHRDPGARLDPPSLVLGPPVLGWRAFCGAQVTSARFSVFVVVPADERALETLWDAVPLVAAAIEENMQAAAVQDGPAAAVPTVYPSGGSELPAYELVIEVDL